MLCCFVCNNFRAKLQRQKQLEVASVGTSNKRTMERNVSHQEQALLNKRLNLMLKHRDHLKRDILKKRALLEKAIQFEVQVRRLSMIYIVLVLN